MPFKKGDRHPNAGRPKGSKNKPKSPDPLTVYVDLPPVEIHPIDAAELETEESPAEEAQLELVAPRHVSPGLLVRNVLVFWWMVINDPKEQKQNKIRVSEAIMKLYASRQANPLHDLDIQLKQLEIEARKIELDAKRQQTTEGGEFSFGFLPTD